MIAKTDPPRIVDAIFGASEKSRRLARLGIPMVCALAIHLAFVWIARVPSHSLEEWSEQISHYVHEHVVVVERIHYEPPPPPPPALPAVAPPARAEAITPRAPDEAPTPAAQAAQLVAASHDSVDLSDQVFVEGSASSYAGGATAPGGTASQAVTGPLAINQAATTSTTQHSLASGVALRDEDWTCPWPEEADDAEIDEQLTVVRVVVRADGTAESARAISGTEHGFGRAAVDCAMEHRYVPARDRDGASIRAESAPVHVTFTRRAS